MKSLQQQLKDIAKNIEKGLNKELAKKKISIPYEAKGNISMTNTFLDKESEQTLKKLVSLNNDGYFLVSNEEYSQDIIEDLIDKGYLKVGHQGVIPQGFAGGFVACVMVTRNGKCYDELKEKYELSNTKSINYGTINDFSNAQFQNSTLQVGNGSATQNIQITNKLVDEAINEINENIDKYGLSDNNKQELKEIVEDIKEKNEKKPNLVIRALKGLWGFAKEASCGLLIAYLTQKFGFNAVL